MEQREHRALGAHRRQAADAGFDAGELERPPEGIMAVDAERVTAAEAVGGQRRTAVDTDLRIRPVDHGPSLTPGKHGGL